MNLFYYNEYRFNSPSQNCLKNSLSDLHINIRSMNKNFEKLCEYLSHVEKNLVLQLLQRRGTVMIKLIKIHYEITKLQINASNQEQRSKQRSYNRLNLKILRNKNIDNNDIKCLNTGIAKKTSKNVIIFCIDRPPRNDANKFLDEIKIHIVKKQLPYETTSKNKY